MALDEAALPDGWVVWNEGRHRLILAYRPDVFDGGAFPAPCMPTIYLTKGQRSRRPGAHDPDPAAAWYVTLYLEPDVDAGTDSFDDRAAADEAALSLAAEFAAGDIDYRGLYQVPREAYFERLDDLTRRER